MAHCRGTAEACTASAGDALDAVAFIGSARGSEWPGPVPYRSVVYLSPSMSDTTVSAPKSKRVDLIGLQNKKNNLTYAINYLSALTKVGNSFYVDHINNFC